MADPTRIRQWAMVAVLMGTASARAADTEVDYSAFGTLGYTQSNQSAVYDRFIDHRGTLRRDSVAGVQVDAKAFDQFGATVQVKAAPSTDHDDRYEGSVSWAFLSWRPSNDWLFRVGKQRIPFYLYSETVDVGVSYDFARLPIEMYSVAPNNDFVGASVHRTFRVADGELAVEGYYGRSSNDFRVFARDDVPTIQSRGPTFTRLIFRGGGLVVSYRDDDRHFRAGVVRASIRQDGDAQFAAFFPYVPIFPGTGYYQVSNALPGPGVVTVPSVLNTFLVVGADFGLPAGFRTTAEFSHSTVPHSFVAPRGNRGYLAFSRPVAQWTPYVSYAFLKSPSFQLDAYTSLNDNTVPAFIPGASLVNASQRIGADATNVYAQHSWALGTSYALNATSRLKAEFLATRIGSVSLLVDAPAGGTPRDLSIKSWSVSYSVVFQ